MITDLTMGVNADPNWGINPDELRSIGVKFVRFPLWEDTGFDYNTFIHNCQVNLIEPIVVLDKRALAKPSGRSYAYKMNRLAKRYPWVKYWQIGNEPDGGGDSSWSQTQRAYSQLIFTAKSFLPRESYIIAGGFCFVKPGWVDKLAKNYSSVIMSCCDAVAIHQYGVYPNEDFPLPDTGFGPASVTLAKASVFGLPVFITEFGGELGLFNSRDERAEWMYHMSNLYRQTSWVEVALWFCYHNYLDFGMDKETKETFKVIAT